jgi:hypothetical protein
MSKMVERTVSLSYGTFAWEETVPLFKAADGSPTQQDTGERFIVRRTGKPAEGVVTRTALRGSTVLLPVEAAERGDALGALDPVGAASAAPTGRASEPFTVEWLQASTANEVLDAVGDDADMARSLASIEEGQDKPRTSLITRLRKIK